MICSNCNQDGISKVSKILLLWNLNVKCKLCGSSYKLSFGLNIIIQTLMYASVLTVIAYAYSVQNILLLWIGTVITIILMSIIAMNLPINIIPGRGIRK